MEGRTENIHYKSTIANEQKPDKTSSTKINTHRHEREQYCDKKKAVHILQIFDSTIHIYICVNCLKMRPHSPHHTKSRNHVVRRMKEKKHLLFCSRNPYTIRIHTSNLAIRKVGLSRQTFSRTFTTTN